MTKLCPFFGQDRVRESVDDLVEKVIRVVFDGDPIIKGAWISLTDNPKNAHDEVIDELVALSE